MRIALCFVITILLAGPACTDESTPDSDAMTADVPSVDAPTADTPSIDAPALPNDALVNDAPPSDTPSAMDAPIDTPVGPTSCDARAVSCERLPPSCAPNEAPSVIGLCWGPCILATECPCTSAEECPDVPGYSETCHTGRGFCGPYL